MLIESIKKLFTLNPMYIIVDFYTLLCEKLCVTPMGEFIVKDFQMSVPLFVDFAQGIYFSSRNNLELERPMYCRISKPCFRGLLSL